MKLLHRGMFSILVVSVLFMAACDRAGQAASTVVQKTEDGVPVYDTNQTYPYEDFSDKAFYQHPRLQFVWDKRNDGLPELMSIRTDGTDLRKVIDSEKLFYDGATSFTHKPVRSPNRRYLAYSNTAAGISLPDRVLYDLKTGSPIVMVKSQTGTPQFFWSQDSENLFFHGDDMYRYHVPSKTLHKLPEFIYGEGIFALNDNKTIVAVTDEGLTYHDYSGKLLREYKLPFGKHVSPFRYISSDGRYFVYLRSDNSLFYSLSNESEPTFIKKLSLPRFGVSHAVFNVDNEGLFVYTNKGIGQFDLNAEVISEIVRFESGITYLTNLY